MTSSAVVVIGAILGALGGVVARCSVLPDLPRPSHPHPWVCSRSGTVPVALAGGAGCGLLAAAHPHPELIAYWWLVLIGLALSYHDLTTGRLPNRLCLAAYLGVTAGLGLSALMDHDPHPLVRALLGGLLLAASLLAVALRDPQALGIGDAKLAASLGTALAWTSWTTLLVGLLAALCLAALPSAVALTNHGRRQQIALGPYLIAGTVLALLLTP